MTPVAKKIYITLKKLPVFSGPFIEEIMVIVISCDFNISIIPLPVGIGGGFIIIYHVKNIFMLILF
jgi:hypothetical protein